MSCPGFLSLYLACRASLNGVSGLILSPALWMYMSEMSHMRRECSICMRPVQGHIHLYSPPIPNTSAGMSAAMALLFSAKTSSRQKHLSEFLFCSTQTLLPLAEVVYVDRSLRLVAPHLVGRTMLLANGRLTRRPASVITCVQVQSSSMPPCSQKLLLGISSREQEKLYCD